MSVAICPRGLEGSLSRAGRCSRQPCAVVFGRAKRSAGSASRASWAANPASTDGASAVHTFGP
jgi:hypothetical protein